MEEGRKGEGSVWVVVVVVVVAEVVAEEDCVSGGGGWEKGWGMSLRRLIKMQLTFFFFVKNRLYKFTVSF